jgi:hypothetical protein
LGLAPSLRAAAEDRPMNLDSWVPPDQFKHRAAAPGLDVV